MIMVLGPHKKKADARSRCRRPRSRAAERAADQAAERAERGAAHAAGPVAAKKERRRSENLDPEIDAPDPPQASAGAPPCARQDEMRDTTDAEEQEPLRCGQALPA